MEIKDGKMQFKTGEDGGVVATGALFLCAVAQPKSKRKHMGRVLARLISSCRCGHSSCAARLQCFGLDNFDVLGAGA